MAIDSFLYFNEVNIDNTFKVVGESQDSVYKNNKALEINSYSFGVENVASIGSKAGGAGTGKANFDVFEFTKNVDSCSAALYAACTQGAHYDEVNLHLRRAGGETVPQPYIKFKFKMVFMTGVKWSGSGDDVPEETLTFAYGALAIIYQPQGSDGKNKGSPLEARWSQVLNKASEAVA